MLEELKKKQKKTHLLDVWFVIVNHHMFGGREDILKLYLSSQKGNIIDNILIYMYHLPSFPSGQKYFRALCNVTHLLLLRILICEIRENTYYLY